MGEIKFIDVDVEKDRDKFVGGSDYPTLTGTGTFHTAYQLYLDKAGIQLAISPESHYTAYGKKMEPIIRDYINRMDGMNYQPASIIRPRLKMRGNLDGLDNHYHQMLEIKTNSKGECRRSYIDQVEFYMATGEKHIKDGIIAVYARPDDFYIGISPVSYPDEDFNLEFDPARLHFYMVHKTKPFKNKMIKENVRNFMKIVKSDKIFNQEQFRLIWKGLVRK